MSEKFTVHVATGEDWKKVLELDVAFQKHLSGKKVRQKLWGRVVPSLQSTIAKNFETGGAYWTGAWAPREQSTAYGAQSNRIGVDTGEMLDALTRKGARGNICMVPPTGEMLTYGIDPRVIPQAAWFNEGFVAKVKIRKGPKAGQTVRKQVPPRPLMPAPENDPIWFGGELPKLVENWVHESLLEKLGERSTLHGTGRRQAQRRAHAAQQRKEREFAKGERAQKGLYKSHESTGGAVGGRNLDKSVLKQVKTEKYIDPNSAKAKKLFDKDDVDDLRPGAFNKEFDSGKARWDDDDDSFSVMDAMSGKKSRKRSDDDFSTF